MRGLAEIVMQVVMLVVRVIQFLMTIPLWVIVIVSGSNERRMPMQRALVTFILCGFVWVPLAQIQVISKPISTYLGLTDQAIGVINMQNDIKKTTGKLTPDMFEKPIKRYRLDSMTKNTMKTAGVYEEPLSNKFRNAVLAPFRVIKTAITGVRG